MGVSGWGSGFPPNIHGKNVYTNKNINFCHPTIRNAALGLRPREGAEPLRWLQRKY